jgi:hypothetical protein
LGRSLCIYTTDLQISFFAQPVTKRQKTLLQPIVVKSDSAKAKTTNNNGPEGEGKPAKKNEATELRPFYLLATNRMHHILRNSLSFLRVVGPQLPPTLLTNRDQLERIDWDAFKPLFDDQLSFEVRSLLFALRFRFLSFPFMLMHFTPHVCPQTPSLPLPTTKRTGLQREDDDDEMLVDSTDEGPRAGGFSILFGDQSKSPRPTLGLLVKGLFHVRTFFPLNHNI